MIELLHYLIKQVVFKISSKNDIAIVYVFPQSPNVYDVNIKSTSIAFLQHTNYNDICIITLPCLGLQCVIVVFPDHTHLLFYQCILPSSQ